MAKVISPQKAAVMMAAVLMAGLPKLPSEVFDGYTIRRTGKGRNKNRRMCRTTFRRPTAGKYTPHQRRARMHAASARWVRGGRMNTHRATINITALLCIDTRTCRVTRYCGRRPTHAAKFGEGETVWREMGTPEYREVLETMRATPERIPGLA